MTERENVIYSIERCICHVPDACRDCAYDAGHPYNECVEMMLRDALELLKAQESGWISVKDRLPVETHSIFWPWYGKKEWSKAMWREQSDKVLVTVKFRDGSEVVTTGETHDGVWHTTISRTLEPVVTNWMPLPEPPKEG